MYNVCCLAQSLHVCLAFLDSLDTGLPRLNHPIYFGVQTSASILMGTRFLPVPHWPGPCVGARGAHHHGRGPLEDVKHFPFSSTNHISAHHDPRLELDLTLSRCEGVFDLAARSELEFLTHPCSLLILILELKSLPDCDAAIDRVKGPSIRVVVLTPHDCSCIVCRVL